MSDRMDQIRRAIEVANDRADAAIGRTEEHLAGQTEAGERLHTFVTMELRPALQALERDVADVGGDLAITREYNDPTQYRYAIVGVRPEPYREAFRATLNGVIVRTGQIHWTLNQASGITQPIEAGSVEAVRNAILDAYTLALAGS
jgi:hypothetical protein